MCRLKYTRSRSGRPFFVDSIKRSLKVCCTTTLLHALLINTYELFSEQLPEGKYLLNFMQEVSLCKWLVNCKVFSVFPSMFKEHICLWIKILWLLRNLWKSCMLDMLLVLGWGSPGKRDIHGSARKMWICWSTNYF